MLQERTAILIACFYWDERKWFNQIVAYRQTSNISHILVGIIIVENSPVGAAPTTSELST